LWRNQTNHREKCDWRKRCDTISAYVGMAESVVGRIPPTEMLVLQEDRGTRQSTCEDEECIAMHKTAQMGP
jgi:hypothetical protein